MSNSVCRSLQDNNDDSFHSQQSSTHHGNHGHNDDNHDNTNHQQAQVRKILSERDNQAVNGMRYVVTLLLSVTTIVVSGGMYWYMKNDQKHDFENQFSGYAGRIVDNFDQELERKLAAFDALAVSYTSHSLATGNNFPNVTLPHADIRMANTRILADTLFCTYMVLVTNEDRAGWEAYAAENEKWMDEAYLSEVDQRTRQDARFNLTTSSERHRRALTSHTQAKNARQLQLDGFMPKIYELGENFPPRPDGSGPFLAYWQNSPVMPSKALLNFDVLVHPLIRNTLLRMMETQQAVLDMASNLLVKVDGEQDRSRQVLDFNLANGQYRHQIEKYEGSPISGLVYPVFDSFGEDRKVTGAFSTALFWREHFVKVLPENAKPVIAVVENTCNQSFSFYVHGDDVTYLGPEDAHDPKYDDLVIQREVASSLKTQAAPNNRAYTTVGLDDNMCHYTIAVYPSQALEDAFVNTKPIIFTTIVASIFIFTSLVFVIYDFLVARRQRIVMTKALQSGAIVSSLFPENVQSRLFGEEENTSPRLNKRQEATLEKLDDIDKEPKTKDAIADLFPNCTVLFADIAGFTGWSSGRGPKDVFELLETLFGAFDAIALKRKGTAESYPLVLAHQRCLVFKVETIGDCYLAVTGLPEAQEDHAFIMCKFANEIALKMSEIRNDLAEKLGPETAELQLRIGLHSGPVTAGVLRGQKSRFQLFGDTVNTASRMESTCEKGRIQISQTTANELIRRGNQHWLVPRENKVVAKGKGEMRTYWLRLKSTKSSITSGDTTTTGAGECPVEVEESSGFSEVQV